MMNTRTTETETAVRNHLRTFLERKGVAAILSDYDADARLYSEARVYHGTREIQDFFTGFLEALPAAAFDRFAVRTLRVEGNLAYLTWSAGPEIPLGTDTFVVENGKIVAQTFAMHAGDNKLNGGAA